MNEYILKVMRYIDNPEAFTAKEMEANNYAAQDIAFGKKTTPSYTVIVAHASRNILTKNQKYAAKYWVSQYFEAARKENKQDYIDEVERLR